MINLMTAIISDFDGDWGVRIFTYKALLVVTWPFSMVIIVMMMIMTMMMIVMVVEG